MTDFLNSYFTPQNVVLSSLHLNLYKTIFNRVIDVGSEWRTFSNEKSGVDPSRVGGPENPLLSGGDLSTIIGPGRGDASFDSFGVSKYQNRRNISSTDRALINAFREISTMADRINLPKTIVDRANNLFKQVSQITATILKYFSVKVSFY